MKTIKELNMELVEKKIKIAKVQHIGNSKRNYYFKTIMNGLRQGNRVIVETREGLKEVIFIGYVEAENFSIVHPDRFVVCRRNILKEDIKNYSISN